MTPEERIKAYGSPDAFPAQLELKAGQLDVLYENGSLRFIKLGNTEIIRMIYSAVRDQNWGTVKPKIESEIIRSEESSFEISLKVSYLSGPINFIADYHIAGANNKICFEMSGKAQSDFLKNRIGFCVLHPISECTGKSGKIIHPDGSNTDFIFPVMISAHQLARNIQKLVWSPESGISATLNFSGDIFEMEDQRNWTDASFKTYCTPLGLPFPVRLSEGETVSQVVELIVENELIRLAPAKEFVFSIYPDQVFSLPELGTAMSSRKESFTQYELELLIDIPLKHLRIEVNPSQPEFGNNLEKAASESSLLGWPLFVVLYLSNDYQNEYDQFVKLCREFRIDVAYLVPIDQNHLAFNAFEELEGHIRNNFPGAKLGTGVTAYFAELNRNRPSVAKADFVCFTICPQVHAFDNLSLVENLEAQAEVIKSAKILYPDKPIFVSPVSLKQRFNVVATSIENELEEGLLPFSVDPRQMSVFAASWTLGSLKFLTQAGVDLVSYYETVGWKGFIQGEYLPDCPGKFRAKAKDIFPVYEIMKEIVGFSEVIHTMSSHPLLFDGFVVKSGQETKLFLFNFSPENIEIRVDPNFLMKSIRSIFYNSIPHFSKLKFQLRAWDLIVISY